jgi:predicted nucleic acid-binding protein
MMDKRRYWDACTFLAWFNNEQDKIDSCRGVVRGAQDGEITIVTSAITLTEVVWLRGQPKLSEQDEEKIKRFFEQDFIAVRVVDRKIGEDARQLIWKHHLHPKDAIHVAAALQLKLAVFDTFDNDLIHLSSKLGNPKLRIGHPDIPLQEEIEFEDDEDKSG